MEADSYELESGVSLVVKTATINTLTISGGTLVVKESASVPTAFTLAGGVELAEGALLYAPTATLTHGHVYTDGTRGYFAIPSNADASQVEFASGAIRLNTDAGASNFSADVTKTTVEFSWSAAKPTALERVAPYELLSAPAVPENPPETFVTSATEFRLWNGSQWLNVIARPEPVARFYTVESWGEKPDDVVTGDFATAWGVSPNIEH